MVLVEVAGQEKVFLVELDDQRVEDRRELRNLAEKRLCLALPTSMKVLEIGS